LFSFAGASLFALCFAHIGNKISDWFLLRSSLPNPSVPFQVLTPIVSKCLSPVFALSAAHVFDLFIVQRHTWLDGIVVKNVDEEDILNSGLLLSFLFFFSVLFLFRFSYFVCIV
jgi:hypothetical protein